MTIRNLSILCLCFFHFGGLSAQFQDLPLNELEALVANPPDDTTELAARYWQFDRLDKANDPMADSLLNLLVERAKQINNNYYLGEAYRRFAFKLIDRGKFDSSLVVVRLSQTKYLGSDDPRAKLKHIGAMVNEGVFLQVAGQLDEALEIYEVAREKALAAGHLQYQSKILNNMGVIFRRLDRTEAAARIYRDAIEIKERMKDSIGIANSLYNLGTVEMQLKDNQGAMASFSRSRELYLGVGDTAQAATVDIGIGAAYYHSDQFAKAKASWEKAINTPGIRPTRAEAVSLYVGLGDIYLKEADYTASLEMFKGAESLMSPSTDIWMRNDLAGALGRVNYELGNHAQASEYYRRFQSGVDTLYSAEKLSTAQEMSEKYEAELREAEIERQELVIDSQRTRALLLGIGITALAGLALGIFVLYRSRLRYQRSENAAKMLKKERELLAVQQQAELDGLRKMMEGEEAERTRVAKDLHDGLGGMLSSIKTRIALGDAPAEEAELLLDRACKEVRRIAHNMVPQSLALTGLSGSLEDIKAQLHLQGLECELEIIGQPELRLEPREQSMLLRIVQELTHNIVKHADADRVFIQLLDQPNQLLLTIEDDGKGFEPTKVDHQNRMGLGSINSRVEYLKGEILYDSQPGHGTTVTLNIPV